jgi:hypothetical protein
MVDRDITNPPPQDIWLGKVRGQWPVAVLHSEDQAARWLMEGKPGDRRAWKVTEMTLEEVELVPPVPAGIRTRQEAS